MKANKHSSLVVFSALLEWILASNALPPSQQSCSSTPFKVDNLSPFGHFSSSTRGISLPAKVCASYAVFSRSYKFDCNTRVKRMLSTTYKCIMIMFESSLKAARSDSLSDSLVREEWQLAAKLFWTSLNRLSSWLVYDVVRMSVVTFVFSLSFVPSLLAQELLVLLLLLRRGCSLQSNYG